MVVDAALRPRLETTGAPQRSDLGGCPLQACERELCAERFGDSRYAERRGHDVTGQLGGVADQQIRAPVGGHGEQAGKLRRRVHRPEELREHVVRSFLRVVLEQLRVAPQDAAGEERRRKRQGGRADAEPFNLSRGTIGDRPEHDVSLHQQRLRERDHLEHVPGAGRRGEQNLHGGHSGSAAPHSSTPSERDCRTRVDCGHPVRAVVWPA